MANLGLVVRVVNKTNHRVVGFKDLVQEGTIGLMEALDRYEYERGHRFGTYASWWIKRAVSMAAGGRSSIIRVPDRVRQQLGEVTRESRRMSKQLGRSPTSREIAEAMGMTLRTLDRLLTVVRAQPIEELGADPARDLLHHVPDPNGVDPLEDSSDRERHDKLLGVLRQLPPREQKVLRLRFGIGRKATLTLREVGRILSLSRERVRQIEVGALSKLQAMKEMQGLG